MFKVIADNVAVTEDLYVNGGVQYLTELRADSGRVLKQMRKPLLQQVGGRLTQTT